MTRDHLHFLLGLAAGPVMALGALLGWRAGRAVTRWWIRRLRGIPLGPPASRATFAAICACSRRVYAIDIGGASLVLTLGFSAENYDAVRKAVYRVLRPMPAPPAARWAQKPSDAGLDFTNDGDDEIIEDARD